MASMTLPTHRVPLREPCGQDVPMLSRAFPQRAPVTGGRILELTGGGVAYEWVVNKWRSVCVMTSWNKSPGFPTKPIWFQQFGQTKRRLLKNIRKAQEALRFSTWNLFEKNNWRFGGWNLWYYPSNVEAIVILASGVPKLHLNWGACYNSSDGHWFLAIYNRC